jgi:hypothetical protein
MNGSEIIRYKYLKTSSLNDSHMLYDLLKIKDIYLQGRSQLPSRMVRISVFG